MCNIDSSPSLHMPEDGEGLQQPQLVVRPLVEQAPDIDTEYFRKPQD